MADSVTSTVLFENKSYYEILLTNISDGTGESAVTKVDVSTLTPACDEVALVSCHYATSGMSVRLFWDATTDVPFLLLPPDHEGHICLDQTLRGVVLNSSGVGKTGDVQLTTFGHTLGDTYWMVLRFRKLLTTQL